MKRRTFLPLLLTAPLRKLAAGQAPAYPHRWVYVSRSLLEDRHVEDIREVARTAGEHGLNGMVLAAGLDRLSLQPPDYFRRLGIVQGICRQHGLEIIPIIFSAGYGGDVLAYNRNLAEGIPVKDALFVARNGEARLEPDPPIALVNPGLKEHEADHATDYALQQEIAVRPHRCYRVAARVKTEQLAPEGSFRLHIRAEDGRALAPWDPQLPPTAGWRRLTIGFNSLSYDKVRIYAGARGAKSGKFWVDDLSIEEVGLTNVLRRGGTPVTVRGDSQRTVFEEGRDYALIADPQLNFGFDHDGPAIRILSGSRIQDGERLRVSYYHGISINRGQVTICMSEPEVYEIWRKQARMLHDLLHPNMYLLSMDEIRAGGTCEACKRRGITMAQILGDCITRQTNILRGMNPKAQIFIWSDMLDPNHNAHAKYYLVDGDYTGSWNYVPKDLIVVCWYYDKRRESLAHFSRLGFRALAGAYYDGDTLENPRGWLEALAATSGACGILYTTWQDKYDLLAPFGDLVSRERPKPAGAAQPFECF